MIAVGTFIRDPEANLYNLYVVDPSAQQILRVLAGGRRRRLPDQPDAAAVGAARRERCLAMYIDGDIWIADGGQILRLVGGKTERLGGRHAGRRRSSAPAPAYRLIASGAHAARAPSTASTP